MKKFIAPLVFLLGSQSIAGNLEVNFKSSSQVQIEVLYGWDGDGTQPAVATSICKSELAKLAAMIKDKDGIVLQHKCIDKKVGGTVDRPIGSINGVIDFIK